MPIRYFTYKRDIGRDVAVGASTSEIGTAVSLLVYATPPNPTGVRIIIGLDLV
jgi:hypothetical protein